jgi:hypothetical protein
MITFYYPMPSKHKLFVADRSGKKRWVDMEGQPIKMDESLTEIFQGATTSAIERLGMKVKSMHLDVSDIFVVDENETIKEMTDEEARELYHLYEEFRRKNEGKDDGNG